MYDGQRYGSVELSQCGRAQVHGAIEPGSAPSAGRRLNDDGREAEADSIHQIEQAVGPEVGDTRNRLGAQLHQ
jgi:hypothetical protein